MRSFFCHTTRSSSIYMDFPCILLESLRFQWSKTLKNRVLAVIKNRKMVEKLFFSGNVRSRLELPKKWRTWKLDQLWPLYSEFRSTFGGSKSSISILNTSLAKNAKNRISALRKLQKMREKFVFSVNFANRLELSEKSENHKLDDFGPIWNIFSAIFWQCQNRQYWRVIRSKYPGFAVFSDF